MPSDSDLITRGEAKAVISLYMRTASWSEYPPVLAALDAVPAAEGRWEKLRAKVEYWRDMHEEHEQAAAAWGLVVKEMDRLSPPAGEKAEGARQYDEHGQPVCPHCGKKTNRAYAKLVKLQCWSCGLSMPDLTSRHDAAQRE